MINTKTRQLYNEFCSLIRDSGLPPVNVELVLSLILQDVQKMTTQEISREASEEILSGEDKPVEREGSNDRLEAEADQP